MLLSGAFDSGTLAETDMRADTIPRLGAPLHWGLQRRAMSYGLSQRSPLRG